MATHNRVRITSHDGKTKIEIDGVELRHVKALNLHAHADNAPPTLRLDLYVLELEVDGETLTETMKAE